MMYRIPCDTQMRSFHEQSCPYTLALPAPDFATSRRLEEERMAEEIVRLKAQVAAAAAAVAADGRGGKRRSSLCSVL